MMMRVMMSLFVCHFIKHIKCRNFSAKQTTGKFNARSFPWLAMFIKEKARFRHFTHRPSVDRVKRADDFRPTFYCR